MTLRVRLQFSEAKFQVKDGTRGAVDARLQPESLPELVSALLRALPPSDPASPESGRMGGRPDRIRELGDALPTAVRCE
jgi:hypothetical protein